LPTRANIDHVITPRLQIQENIFVEIFEKIGSEQKNPTDKNIMPTLID
jgi:hypothetical protein